MFRTQIFIAGFTLLLLTSSLGAAEPVTAEVQLARPTAVAYAPDGAEVAVGGLETIGDVPNDGLVYILDAHSGQKRGALRHSGTLSNNRGSSASSNSVHAMAYSRDNKVLAVATHFGLKLWNTSTGQETATLLGYGIDEKQMQVEVNSIAFVPNTAL